MMKTPVRKTHTPRKQITSLLQDLAFCCLGISKVHHFIHEFVDDNEVVADRLLLELLEVLDEDLDEAMEEEDDETEWRIREGQGTQPQWARRAEEEEEPPRKRQRVS